MLKRTVYFVLISIIIPFGCDIYSQTIDILGKTVVFLQRESQAYEMKSGEKVEVWYKNPLTKIFEPKILKQSGTGFIIKHNNRDYIVTATHVAKFMDNTSEIIINVSTDSSINISFDLLGKIRLIKNARWFYHPIADIAIHPIAFPTEKLKQLSLNTSDIPKDETNIKLLSDVIILGFPLGLGVHESTSAINSNC